jgi:hypothetical protein
MQEWHHQAIIVSSCANRLIALVLLGKTEKRGEEIGHILKADIVWDNPSWTCKEWVFSAVEVSQLSHLIYAIQPLIKQNIVDRPPIPLENLYAISSTLADAFKEISKKVRGNFPVPTCDNSGVVIPSEVKWIADGMVSSLCHGSGLLLTC